MFCKKGVLRNYTNWTGKHLYQSLFLNKVTDLRPATLLKKRLWRRCFSVNFMKFFRTLFILNSSVGCFCLVYGTLWNWRIVSSSRNSESPWSLQKAGVNRTRLLASPLQSPDVSYLPLERNEYECPANEYFIVTTFILLCLLRYSRMACDIWEFLFWGILLSDQQISSVTFGWSAATLFRICIKALAMSFPTRPDMHSVQIAQ